MNRIAAPRAFAARLVAEILFDGHEKRDELHARFRKLLDSGGYPMTLAADVEPPPPDPVPAKGPAKTRIVIDAEWLTLATMCAPLLLVGHGRAEIREMYNATIRAFNAKDAKSAKGAKDDGDASPLLLVVPDAEGWLVNGYAKDLGKDPAAAVATTNRALPEGVRVFDLAAILKVWDEGVGQIADRLAAKEPITAEECVGVLKEAAAEVVS
ncbi:MAG: hypothetical protein AAF726_20435 [Planctomycetota bacterium]